MRFVLFTDKTTHQCMKALHERMQATETKSRPALDGWIEKSGSFSISLQRRVMGKFTRRTRLRGTAERESGTTVIRGFVPEGVSKEWLTVIGIAVAALAGYMFFNGQLVFAIIILVGGAAMMMSLWGDHRNHDVLLYELEKTLKAKPAPRGTPTMSPRRKTTKSTKSTRRRATKKG